MFLALATGSCSGSYAREALRDQPRAKRGTRSPARSATPDGAAYAAVPGRGRACNECHWLSSSVMPSGLHRRAVCRVLEEDPALASVIPAKHRQQAIRECVSRAVAVPAGRWYPSKVPAEQGIGLLVLDGLLIRRVGVRGTFGAELVGKCDVLRPWQGGEAPTLAITTTWQVIEPARLAVLDEPFARWIARYPQLTGALVGRAIRRSRSLAVNMAIARHPRVDVRLHMLLWALAARWGDANDGTVALRLRLSHEVLSQLVLARRETVGRALSGLESEGIVHAIDEGWLLHRAPPAALLELVGKRQNFALVTTQLAQGHGT